MKVPSHLLSATEVTTCRNINVKTLTSSLICSANQWTGFYMITASVMKELRSYLATIFLSLINAQVSKLVKVIKLRQNQFVNELFS